MAPEPPSPSASTALLPPFLGGRSRRGSVASLSSRSDLDKDALAQALDQIHTTASKSETLTSFHDYDGGSRAGAKELVSNGVSGLYNRLKQSVSGGTPAKDVKARPKTSGSRESVETDSIKSISTSRVGLGLSTGGAPLETASLSTASLAASPVIASFANVAPVESRVYTAERAGDPLSPLKSSHATLEDVGPTPDEVELARSALVGADRSDVATQALARVLSHRDMQQSERPNIDELTRHISYDANVTSGHAQSDTTQQLGSTQGTSRAQSPSSVQDEDTPKSSSSKAQRPPMVHVGPSHLPGFKPSRASSTTDGGDQTSNTSTKASQPRLALEPSPNINSGMQRRRTGMKPQHAVGHVATHVPTHLRRRVISKEFWMKDENAKDCFYCGQGFSAFRRKHHCRTCGQIFDAKCTSLVQGRPFGQPGTIRLCKPCEAMIYGSDDDSTVFSDDGEDLSARSPLTRNSTGDNDDISADVDGSFMSRADAGEVATPSIGIPASRRTREAKRRSAVIEFDAHPTLARPSSSHSLISLSRRPRSSSHRRHNSRLQNARGIRSVDERGPFQQDLTGDPEKQTLLPAFHNDNVIDPDLAAFLSDDGSDDEQPNIMSALDHNPSPGERERFGSSLFASGSKKGRSRIGDRSTAAGSNKGVRDEDSSNRPHPKMLRRRNPSMSSITLSRPSPRRSKSNLLLTTVENEVTGDRSPSPVIPQNSYGSRFMRSSAMQGPHAPPLELNQASLDHVKRLLAQLLKDSHFSKTSAWVKALVPILLRCTDDVRPDVQRGDDMDIRHYVKLKKVPGGKPGDTSYISGVAFSKNVALRSMPRSIKNPRIAIITFAIEYARHQTHFMSLEPVIAQEREYLHNLVGRIATLKPQVLLVQRNVSGLALRLLDEAGITVVFRIKESVLAAVARVTQTPMIKSVDKLAMDASHLGHCDSFEVKTYMHDGMRKSYIYLSGCPPDLGCTIILRGADTRTLRKIKRVTEFMCYVAYNLKLETNLMRDEFVATPPSNVQQLVPQETVLKHQIERDPILANLVEAHTDDDTPSKYEKLEGECRSRILSASPSVVFQQPHLLTQLRDLERKITTFKKLRDQFAAMNIEDSDVRDSSSLHAFALVQPEMVNGSSTSEQPRAVREYLSAVHEAQYQKTMNTYETQRRLWESFMTGGIDPFDPYEHQTIMVLHSTVSSITSAPCVGPELLGMGFYAGFNHVEPQFEEDCTLGQYVEDMCMTANSTCKECGKRMYEHHRQYVHDHGQLAISVQRQPARMRGLSNTILMWSSCRKCQAETTLVEMSDNTWKYSFAKYLELSFWSSPLRPRADLCEHDIHKDFLRCFGFHDLVVRVQYDPIDIYDVVVPKPVLTWKVESDLLVKNEQFSHFLVRLNAFTDSIRKRLDSITVDTLDEKKAIEAHERLTLLRQRAGEDHNELLDKLQRKYADSHYYELIPLNRALRFMDKKAIEWDEEFSNFERDYFPSETDIRKLATLQLRNMFLESQPASASIAGDASDTEDGTEMAWIPPKSQDDGPECSSEHDLQSEKAHDVMSNTVQEHRGSHDQGLPTDGAGHLEASLSTETPLSRTVSPREEVEQAVDREDVKHLDLAVANRSPEEPTAELRQNTTDLSTLPSRPGSQEGPESGEPFAVQPKPLSSGLLERIEQIRNNRNPGGTDSQDAPESKIPRLVDLRKRETSLLPIPPLNRAQSQPGHAHTRSADLESNHSIDQIVNGNGSTETQPSDKRLGERLGVVRLPSKNGKPPPSLIPRSVPNKSEESTSSTVSALAKHFEQMSREFEKERLRERRQRALRSRQARANPLASSQPVVEVYQNATDAVKERAPDETAQEQQSEPEESHSHFNIGSLLSSELINSDEADAHTAPTEVSQDPEVPSEPAALEESEAVNIHPIPNRVRDVSDANSSMTTSALMSPTTTIEMDLHPELSIPEHRKNVWFKYLADFWSKRSASGWANLEYPLHSTEHVFEDSDIIVREDEPSSVIALSLDCTDYRAKVVTFRSHPSKQAKRHAHTHSQVSNNIEDSDEQQQAIEASLLSDTGTHMKYSFAHGPVKASCKIFYAESFDALRRRCGVAERFVESMSRCLKFDSKGGKTKSLFLKTLDDRFIIKSLQEVELKAFTKFAPDYFAFMSYTLFHGVPSVIAKMFGLFQITIKNPGSGMDFSYYLLVMENLFYESNPNRRFDLKGSMRNRKIESTGQPDEVLLDENLVETIFESPLFVREHARKLIQASVWNDTMWLCKQNVMDYSLMAGFDDERKELVVGIIDCIRTYTWDKKLESWIKDRGKNRPTITSPKDYRNRFRVSMMQYVLASPSCWHQVQAQMALPKTLRERDETEDTEAERARNDDRRSDGT